MPKGSAELIDARRHEIIEACVRLYETKNFKDITIKEIGAATSFTRTSIYNYFQTKEEIFLALLKREYEAWNDELAYAMDTKPHMTRIEFAQLLADTLSRRALMLKILSMNMYDIEENSREEKLVEFKKEFGVSLDLTSQCASRCVPQLSEAEIEEFIYAFFPFVYGIYPYTSVTAKQKNAMTAAKIDYHYYNIYHMTFSAAKRLLEVKE